MSAAAFNHSPYATFDDGVLADGAALYAELAVSRLAALAAAERPGRGRRCLRLHPFLDHPREKTP